MKQRKQKWCLRLLSYKEKTKEWWKGWEEVLVINEDYNL